MGKRGPQVSVKDSEIMDLIYTGVSQVQVAERLKLSRGYVRKVCDKYKNSDITKPLHPQVREIIRLEITQENTLSELAKQMKDYTDQYEKAMNTGDERSAYAWSQNRIKLVDMMAKITGLYNPRPIEQTTTIDRPVIVFREVE